MNFAFIPSEPVELPPPDIAAQVEEVASLLEKLTPGETLLLTGALARLGAARVGQLLQLSRPVGGSQ